jgi:PhnB protein
MPVKPVPEGYHSVTPYLVVKGAAALIDFLKQAFDANEFVRMARPDGTIQHAEVRIGDSVVMIGEATSPWEPMPTMLYLYAGDVDAIYQRALKTGATSVQAPADQFYGDRTAAVKDPSGNFWYIATHVEDLSPEEIRRRAEAHAKSQN